MAVESINFSNLSQLTEFVKSLLSKTSRTKKQINRLTNIVHYKDVLFYTWKILMKTLRKSNECSDIFLLNVLDLLEKISINRINTKAKEEENSQNTLGLQKDFSLDFSLLKAYVRKVWMLLINRDMSPAVHKKLLLLLIESYLSKLESPIFLTDFFMASMNVRGVVRILALQGIATLMQKHNIEYPNIYKKLYELFKPNIFHTKYKSRLFYLANIFLTSTHLPEIIVASFAKRASQLTLKASGPDILIILRFVGNLLIRHTGLTKMIHHPSLVEVLEDPFLESENDPMKTQATESSLWEIALLSNHCLPSVSSAARFINGKLPSLEFNLAEVLDSSCEKMFLSECNKMKKMKPSVTYERPQETVAKLKYDELYKLWSLTS